MCCLVLRQKIFSLQIYFLELHMENIDAEQLLNNNQKICCWSKFHCQKIISLIKGFWL